MMKWKIFAAAVILQFAVPQINCKECETFGSLVSNTVLKVSLSYLSDHPRGNKKPVSEVDMVPFTPTSLFKGYYGENASAKQFKSAILRLIYSEEKPSLNRHDARTTIKKCIAVGDMPYAQVKMGELLKDIGKDYGLNHQYWITGKCLEGDCSTDLQFAMQIEYAKIRSEVGETQFGKFLGCGAGTTLAFVIDDTMSMKSELEATKERTTLIIENLKGSLDKPSEYILVPFNDPFVEDITVTEDPDVFKRALGRLVAHGGGDLPEFSLTGIKMAIENAKHGATVYVITDVEAKDFYLQDTVIALARGKDIKVVFMLTSQIDLYCVYQEPAKARRGTPKEHIISEYFTCLKLYQHIAEKTHGKVIIMSKRQLFQVSEMIETNLNQGLELVEKRTFPARRYNWSEIRRWAMNLFLDFFVDPTMTEINVNAQGDCGDAYVQFLPEGVPYHLRSITTHLKSIKIQVDGRYGKWEFIGPRSPRLRRGKCEVRVHTRSILGFDFTLIDRQNSVPAVVNGYSSPTTPITFVLDMHGCETNTDMVPDEDYFGGDDINVPSDEVVMIRFLKADGEHAIYSYDLTDKDIDCHSSLMIARDGGIATEEAFHVTISGDVQGYAFTRMAPLETSTSNIEIQCDLDNIEMLAGREISVMIPITNNGDSPDKFVIYASDKKGFIIPNEGSNSEYIPQGATYNYPLKLKAPEGTRPGTATEITITVRGLIQRDSQYHVCSIVVTELPEPPLEALKVQAVITHRYARTRVQTTYENPDIEERTAEFKIVIPRDAYLVSSQMLVEGKTRYATLKPKDPAALKSPIKPGSKKKDEVYCATFPLQQGQRVTFTAIYEQTLARASGLYEYKFPILPYGLIEDFEIDVQVVETKPFTDVKVLEIKTDQSNKQYAKCDVDAPPAFQPEVAISTKSNDKHLIVNYNPDISEQLLVSPAGISGDFKVQFEIERGEPYYDLMGRYFVYYYTPPADLTVPKFIVYCVDISGSMMGHKIDVVRNAMVEVLLDLQPDDFFNIVLFGDVQHVYTQSGMAPATDENKDDAAQWIYGFLTEGGTDLYTALETAFELLEESFLMPEYPKMITVVTDGNPSVGETDAQTVINLVGNLNMRRAEISVIGVGPYVDNDFLCALAELNGGRHERISENMDMMEQIKTFIMTSSGPAMRNVSIKPYRTCIEEITDNHVPVLFKGEELMVIGRIKEKCMSNGTEEIEEMAIENAHARPKRDLSLVKEKEWDTGVLLFASTTGKGEGVSLTIDPERDAMPVFVYDWAGIGNTLEKMFAQIKVKQLLSAAVAIEENDPDAAFLIKQEAQQISMKYKFLTPVTQLDESSLAVDTGRSADNSFLVDQEGTELGLVEAFQVPFFTAKKETVGTGRDWEDAKGGMWADPHVLVPLQDGMFLCFNWEGQEGEVFNFITDPETGLEVNAEMFFYESSPEKTGPANKTGVYSDLISLYVPSENITVLFRPYNMTIRDLENGFDYTMDYTQDMTIIHDDVRVHALVVNQHKAVLHISFNDFKYLITTMRYDPVLQPSYMDFAVVNQPDGEIGGIIGEFYKAKGTIEKADISEEVVLEDVLYSYWLTIGEQHALVSPHIREGPIPGAGTHFECWEARPNAEDLFPRAHSSYKAKSHWRTVTEQEEDH